MQQYQITTKAVIAHPPPKDKQKTKSRLQISQLDISHSYMYDVTPNP